MFNDLSLYDFKFRTYTGLINWKIIAYFGLNII